MQALRRMALQQEPLTGRDGHLWGEARPHLGQYSLPCTEPDCSAVIH